MNHYATWIIKTATIKLDLREMVKNVEKHTWRIIAYFY